MPPVSKLARAISEREIIYPKRGAYFYVEDEDSLMGGCLWGGGPITGAVAHALLGWTNDAEEAARLGLGEPLGKDPTGAEFWCSNNVRNRPIYFKGDKSVDSVLQEIANARWRYNSEPIILGRTAIVLNGQHTLVAVKFADVLYRLALADQGAGLDWRRCWPDGPPFIEKLVTVGVEETDEVVNTMDTCKPRSLSDVIYRCEYFSKKGKIDQKVLSRVLENAVRYVWSRTGAGFSAFATHHTTSESIDWIERHKSLLKAVAWVYKEFKAKDGAGWQTNNRRIGAGYAAGLLFLMGVSGTPDDKADAYRLSSRQGQGNDRKLDKTLWDKAEQFWHAFASGADSMKNVFEEIGNLSDPDTGHGGSTSAKVCVLVNAWGKWVEGKSITPAAVRPKYAKNERTLQFEQVSWPVLRGIDQGDPHDPANRNAADPEPEQIEGDKVDIRAGNDRDDRDDPAPAVSLKAGTKDRRGHTVPRINFHD